MVSASKPQRALITGAEGFTGKYLAKALTEAGYEVFGTTQRTLDLCDRVSVQSLIKDIQPNVIAHLAGISSVVGHELSKIYETNLLGSLYLLEALAELKIKPRAILLASSANIYGNCASDSISETQIPEPINDYAVSKFAMEQMAKLWMNRLPLFIVRPFNYTGVGQTSHFLIPKIIDHFKTKQAVIYLGNLDVWREFNDVRFVTSAYEKLLNLSPVGQIINICTGQVYSLREIISLCEEITGHSITVQVNPKFVRANEVRILQGDNARLKSLIGDSQFPTLKDTLTWMLNDTGAH